MKTRISLLILLALAFALPVATLMTAEQAGVGRDAPPRPKGPCDIYAAAGLPCVTAHSTTRALSASYDGPLYQVRRDSDGKTLDIGVVPASASPVADPGGYADAAAQDAFCAETVCWITTIYDQSGKGNHLVQAPPGTFSGPAKGGFNTLPIADMAPVTIMGHKVYGVYIMPGMGLRNNNAAGLAINDEPQGVYMVFDGTHYDSGCCFNYGNTSTNSRAVGRGTMDTVYFGTATAWGRGAGPGPWIMSDMEAGLFSGYNSGLNQGSPTIDSWRFVTGTVNGGGGNQWEIRGGNAQEGELSTFYQGARPGSRENNNYFPMHRKGAVQMGNGGDNGNGSAGTFYEGVITTGYPKEDTTDAVQANIVAARYDVPQVTLSRVTTFSPGVSQEATATFTNTTGAPAAGVALRVAGPAGWTATVSGSGEATKTFAEAVAPGASVSATFRVVAPATPGAGTLTARAEWQNRAAGGAGSGTAVQRVRNALPVKINEVRLSTGANPTDQFIELFNAGDGEADLSRWTLINTRSQWAPVTLATIPAGTKLGSGDYYLLGLSGAGLAAPADRGEATIWVSSTTGLEAGKEIGVDGETRTIERVGSAATAMTTVFIPVSTGPKLTIAAGATHLPVTSANGFAVGQKIGIDIGGNYELATVTEVGTAATQTTLSVEAAAGATNIKVAATSNLSVGDMLTVGTGGRRQVVEITNVGSAGARGTGVDLAEPLKSDQMAGVDVSSPGTGIGFTPATRFAHESGDAVQALGSGVTLERPLANDHPHGAPIVIARATTGYQGPPEPDQWYGDPLSTSAGSIALMDASGQVVVDAIVYGSQQSSSSANGTIARPDLATLEGDQSQGGCIVVAPSGGRGGFGRRGGMGGGTVNQSIGRFPDGADTDSLCDDFLVQTGGTTLAMESAAGATNLKVASVAGYSAGQSITIDSGGSRETAVIATVGTAGGTALTADVEAGATVLTVGNTAGLSAGQTIVVGSGDSRETAVVASVSGGGVGGRGFGGGRGGMGGGRGGAGATVTVAAPLTLDHSSGTSVAGTGITLTAALAKAHAAGAQISGSEPTPGAANRYARAR